MRVQKLIEKVKFYLEFGLEILLVGYLMSQSYPSFLKQAKDMKKKVFKKEKASKKEEE